MAPATRRRTRARGERVDAGRAQRREDRGLGQLVERDHVVDALEGPPRVEPEPTHTPFFLAMTHNGKSLPVRDLRVRLRVVGVVRASLFCAVLCLATGGGDGDHPLER